METFGLTILYLTALAAYLSLAWHLYCAVRWLYRWWHPWNEAVDARARAYLVKPHPLWQRPGLTPEKYDETLAKVVGGRPTTVRVTMDSNSDAPTAESMMGPTPPSSQSGLSTTPTCLVDRYSGYAGQSAALKESDRMRVLDVRVTG